MTGSKVTETVHMTAQVPAELAKAVGDLAKANERSTSAELRLALKAHVEANAPKPERVA